MARLDAKQWGKLKAKWLTGKYSNRELGEEFGVSHAAIQKKAKTESWEQIPASVIDKAVDSRAELKKEVSKVSKVSKVETKELDAEIDRLAELKSKLEQNAAHLAGKVPVMADQADKPSDIKMLVEANSKLYETHFQPKGPQVAIQNNNTAQISAISIDPTKISTEALKEIQAARVKPE